jgi:hypothetical protein
VFSAQEQGSFSEFLHYSGFLPQFLSEDGFGEGPFLEMYGVKRYAKQADSAQNTRPGYCNVSFTRYI